MMVLIRTHCVFSLCSVYGGKGDKIPGVTVELGHNDAFTLGSQAQLQVTAYFTPCHTPGHVLYHVACKAASAAPPQDNADAPFSIPVTPVAGPAAAAAAADSHAAPAPQLFTMDSAQVSARGIVFTGDTLFVGGCGNFNKGTPEQMRYALIDVIGSLPGDTLLAVGHEYTAKNLAYACTVEDSNSALQAKQAWVQQRRTVGLPTTPTTVQQEHATNVFMRLAEPAVVSYAVRQGASVTGKDATDDATEVIRQLRASKSAWRG